MLQRFVDPAAVETEVERVHTLSGDALRRRWQAVFARSVPQHLTADLLRRMIANRIQEEAFGSLDSATLKLLDGLARRDGSRQAERNLKIGTVLVRDYQGRRHTVTVAPEGYVWEAQPLPRDLEQERPFRTATDRRLSPRIHPGSGPAF
jgi:hypothetical protein